MIARNIVHGAYLRAWYTQRQASISLPRAVQAMMASTTHRKEPHTLTPSVIVIGAGFYGLAAAKVVHNGL
jgi:threonine dehydrogenase-like Zn-dependent dehydrogenase